MLMIYYSKVKKKTLEKVIGAQDNHTQKSNDKQLRTLGRQMGDWNSIL